jgi:hypothetical protein
VDRILSNQLPVFSANDTCRGHGGGCAHH